MLDGRGDSQNPQSNGHNQHKTAVNDHASSDDLDDEIPF